VTAALLWAKEHDPSSDMAQAAYLLEAEQLQAALGKKVKW
jgi:hypothetical protein